LPPNFGRSKSEFPMRLLMSAVTLVLWGIMLGVVAALPDGHVRQAVLQRGPLPYISVLVFAGVLVIVAFRYRWIIRETGHIRTGGLVTSLRDGPPTLAYALHRCGEFIRADSPMVDRRLIRSVNCAVTARNRQELYVAAREVSRGDEAVSSMSYTLPKLLIWALPISGFTGTMQGMATAIGGFRKLAEARTLEDFASGINVPMYGLAVAFDTTLVALILVSISMFMVSLMQRRERELLATVDGEVAEAVLQRIELGQGEPRGWIDAALMVELWEGFNRIQEQLAGAISRAPGERP